MKISQKAKNAIFLGTLCSVSYLAVYIARNILGAVTPKMTEDGLSLEYIGEVTALYLLSYALGQLINGSIGDRIKAKYMISFGLLSAGISNFVFAQLTELPNIAMIAYAWTGFSLSMIYGPMTKVVAESTELIYATRCSLGYTFASFFGSPMAGVLATFLSWQATFNVSSIVLVIMAVTSFTFFCVFERRGIVKYPERREGADKPARDYKGLLKHHIVKFSLISMITGIIRTALVAYLTTYFVEYLGFATIESTSIFSTATLVISFTAFIAVFVYERLKRNMHLCVLIFFSLAAVCFGSLCFVSEPIVNIIIMVAGIMCSNSSASVLWSIYCPSLRDTGLVSSATGFLDFLSYAAAALASLLVPIIVSATGWRNLLLVIFGLMLLGVIICLPYSKMFKKRAVQE